MNASLDLENLSPEQAAAVERQLQRESCSYFASRNLMGPPEAPYNGRFIIGDHHLEWDDLTQEERACILAPRDHGKCRAVGSIVQAADGRRVRIEDWNGGEVISYDPDTHALVRREASAARSSGVQRCVKITTRTGRVDITTLGHRWRVWDRWLESRELRVGQRVAVPRTLPVTGCEPLPPGQAWFLGLLVGDGGLTGTGITFTTGDVDVVAEARRAAALSGWEVGGPFGEKGQGFSIHANYAKVGGPKQWAREHGIDGKLAHDKRVPAAIFTAPTKDVAAFIAGHFDSDGHASTHGGGMVEFYSVSEGLLRDIHHLLCRLGIVAVLSPKLGKYKGEDHHSWRITIRGRSIITFAERVPLRGVRRHIVQALARLQDAKDEGGSVDLLPSDICSLISKSEDWLRKRGHPRFNRANDMTRTKARAIAAATGDAALAAFADAEVLWDEIVSIEDAGELPTFCLDVPGLENYVGNDIVTHNSFYWNKAFPIWKAAFGRRGELGYIFSVNQDKANEMLQIVVEELTSNPKLAWLVPVDWERRWSKRRIRLTTGVEIRARGFGVKVRGGHPNWIVNDDILSDDNIYSETIRSKATDYYLSAITNMVVPGGQIITIGTPMHQADVYATLRDNGIYKMWERPALDPVTGKALWPARYNRELLERKKKEIGSVRFTREFLVRPMSDDMSLFPGWLFEGEPVRQRNVKMGAPLAYWQSLGIRCYIGVDIALSAETGADYFVVFVLGKDRDGNRWVVDIHREKGVSYARQLDLIVEYSRRYDAALVFVEANQAQRVWGDELIRTTDIPVKKFTTLGRGKGAGKAMSQTANKNDLEKGVPSLRPILENKKFRIPQGDAASVDKARVWIAEMNAFSWIEGKVQGVGSHDDTVMALWIADQAVRRGGFSASFGEDEGVSGGLPGPAPVLAEGRAGTEDARSAAAAANETGAAGNLGGLDPTEMLWEATPFYQR
jgi:intein/homing endonuclease